MFKSAEPLELTQQQGRVIQYLQKGSTLTNVVAVTCLGVGSLSSRIAELRKLGFKIKDEMAKGHDGRSYKKYDIDPEASAPVFTVKGE